MMPSVFAGIDLRAASSNPVPGSLTTAGSLTGEESAVEASFAAMIAGALRAATPVPVAGDPEPVLAVPGGTAPPTVGMFPSPAQELPVPERPGISVPGEPMVRGGARGRRMPIVRRLPRWRNQPSRRAPWQWAPGWIQNLPGLR